MPHYLFVTGRLAEQPLRRVVESLASQVGFDYTVAVMPITIAALITPRWLARRIDVPEGITTVIVPGHCEGDLSAVEEVAKVPVERGPRDFRELPEYFGQQADAAEYGAWNIEIIAKIARADELSIDEILDRAANLADDGADAVLLSGSGRPWKDLADLVRELREESQRVAVANVIPVDLLSAVPHGIELVVPADSKQQKAAAGLGCEIVLQQTCMVEDQLGMAVEKAIERGTRFRLDPGLRAIGLGLAESLGQYLDARSRWPDVAMTMSFDTVTETTAVDSAAVHVLLMGLCQELGVGSVIVGQDSNWNRTAIRECHLARQVSRYVIEEKTPAEEPGLLMLRDAAALQFGREELDHLTEILTDPSPRIFAEDGRLHAIAAGKHLESEDPYDLFDQIVSSSERTFDPEKAFYLGYEMAKAVTALTLGKTYRQDEALDWGLLTQRELTRLERRALRIARLRDGDCEETKRYFEEDDLDDAVEESDE